MTDYPSSPDAERATLSCALQWAECFDQVASHPSGSELFYSPANREIWEAASEMHRNGEEIDVPDPEPVPAPEVAADPAPAAEVAPAPAGKKSKAA